MTFSQNKLLLLHTIPFFKNIHFIIVFLICGKDKTFNLLFYVKKAKINSVGESPIYLRITIDGKISEISTKRTIKPSKWSSAMQKVSGSSEECKSLNFYLKTFEQRSRLFSLVLYLLLDERQYRCSRHHRVQ